MLEHQQTQLIAGVRELYRRMVKKEPWPEHPLETSPDGQPLTHRILEALDILKPDEWDDASPSTTATSDFLPVLPDSPPTTPAFQSMPVEPDCVNQGISRHGPQAHPNICGLTPCTTATPLPDKKRKERPELKLQMPPSQFPCLNDQQSLFPLLVTPPKANWDVDWMFDLDGPCGGPTTLYGGLGLSVSSAQTS